MLSMPPALLAPVTIMKQSRAFPRCRRAAAEDYAVNLRTELEVRAINERLAWMAANLASLAAAAPE